jgi:hypothetical protein
VPHPRRKIRDANDADEQLAAARAACMSNRDWAVQNGICARSLHMWAVLRGRKRRPAVAPTLQFVELVTMPPATPIRVLRHDLVVELPLDCGADVLARVLTAIRAC